DIRTGWIIRRGTEKHGLYYVDEVTQSGTVMLAHGTTERGAWLWHRRTSLFTVIVGAMGSMSFLTPFSVVQGESGILWKLILLFPDLKVMVPLSNLIVALTVVRNGVPKMKGLFLVFLDIQNHKVYTASYAARYFKVPSDVLLLCYLLLEDCFINRPSRSKRYNAVPYEELKGILIALVARFGLVSKSTDKILVSHVG
nr:putative ribonuclease H-like domain-containing protein [Tanacetum cinerariifolium]